MYNFIYKWGEKNLIIAMFIWNIAFATGIGLAGSLIGLSLIHI